MYTLVRLIPSIMLALTLVGCGGGGGGLVSPSTTDGLTLNTSGYSGSLDTAIVSYFQNNQEFKNISQYSGSGTPSSVASTLHPFSLTNVDQAYGYGLSGAGITIGIIDSGFANDTDYVRDDAFLEMKTKKSKITFVGSITNPCSGSSCNTHGTNVASVAAAAFDNQGDQYFLANTGLDYNAYSGDSFPLLNHGMMGVAFNSNLRIGDFNSYNGSLSGIAQLTNSMVGAKALNNSWGLEINLPASVPADISTYTASQASAWLRANTGNILSAADIEGLHAAYKNFQSSGVVVFALQNTTSDSTPSLMAALPEVFPDLENSWIAVGNIDTSGSSRDTLRVTRKSARCGATAPYCLVTDGSEITAAGLYKSDGYNRGLSGTSFSAPQVSGMIALLAEAFPSLNSEQLAARLLATAYNGFSGFTGIGSKTFSNGIVHRYSAEFGHGIPDMKAALNPIVSNAVPLGFITGGSPLEGERIALSKSRVVTTALFGDAIRNALVGQTAYVYDALGGGFEIDLLSQISTHKTPSPLSSWSLPSMTSPKTPALYTNLELGEGTVLLATNASLSSLNEMQLRGDGEFGFANRGKNFALTDYDQGALTSIHEITAHLQYGENIKTHAFASRKAPSDKRDSRILGVGLNYTLEKSARSDVSINTGILQEYDTVRGAQSSGALSLGSKALSLYFAPSIYYTRNNFALSTGASLETTYTNPEVGLLKINGAIIASSFFSKGTWGDVIKNKDLAYIKLWQPARLEQGHGTLKLPTLVSPESSVAFGQVQVSLTPSGRTINLAAGYDYPVNNQQNIITEIMLSREPNHTENMATEKTLRVNWLYTF
jgi:subtilase-type serine protease